MRRSLQSWLKDLMRELKYESAKLNLANENLPRNLRSDSAAPCYANDEGVCCGFSHMAMFYLLNDTQHPDALISPAAFKDICNEIAYATGAQKRPSSTGDASILLFTYTLMSDEDTLKILKSMQETFPQQEVTPGDTSLPHQHEDQSIIREHVANQELNTDPLSQPVLSPASQEPINNPHEAWIKMILSTIESSPQQEVTPASPDPINNPSEFTSNPYVNSTPSTFVHLDAGNPLFHNILAFLDGVELFQQLYKHPELLPNGHVIYKQQHDAVLPLLTPTVIQQQGGIVSAAKYCSVFDHDSKDEIKSFFKCFEDALSSTTSYPIAFQLQAERHSISIYFDPRTQNWTCIDINQGPETRDVSIHELSHWITEAFDRVVSCPNPYKIMNVEIFVLGNKVDDLQSKLSVIESGGSFKQILQITPEKLVKRDRFGDDIKKYVWSFDHFTHDLSSSEDKKRMSIIKVKEKGTFSPVSYRECIEKLNQDSFIYHSIHYYSNELKNLLIKKPDPSIITDNLYIRRAFEDCTITQVARYISGRQYNPKELASLVDENKKNIAIFEPGERIEQIIKKIDDIFGSQELAPFFERRNSLHEKNRLTYSERFEAAFIRDVLYMFSELVSNNLCKDITFTQRDLLKTAIHNTCTRLKNVDTFDLKTVFRGETSPIISCLKKMDIDPPVFGLIDRFKGFFRHINIKDSFEKENGPKPSSRC